MIASLLLPVGCSCELFITYGLSKYQPLQNAFFMKSKNLKLQSRWIVLKAQRRQYRRWIFCLKSRTETNIEMELMGAGAKTKLKQQGAYFTLAPQLRRVTHFH
jgi:hypothetical protein